jgi:energy-coupling factor transport system permease protein
VREGGWDVGAFGQVNAKSNAMRLLLGTVIGLTIVVAVFKGISVHFGTTVLFRLPEEWPVIGGPITLEGIVSSSLDGLSLLTVLAVFAAFSAGADYYAILRSGPPFLHQVGLITSIAITFVPKTVERFTEIREAQALRGHRVRRVGDLLPIIMPLLAGGMESSMNLAEAMEARGFSRDPSGSRRVRPIISQIGLAIGISLVLIGGTLPAFLGTIEVIGWATVTSGIGVIAVTLWAIGRGTRRERYRRSVWRERDTALASLSIGIITFLITYRIQAPSTLVYYPFPSVHLPQFDPVVALALVGLTAPILILLVNTREGASRKIAVSYDKQLQRLRNDNPRTDSAGGTGAPDSAAHTGHVRE